MKRSFNYTDRVKITQRAVKVRLFNDTDGVQAFDIDIDLSGYELLPKGTKIYVEAYYRSALMRFDVGAYDPNQVMYLLRGKRLDELQDPTVSFRIKLVDVRQQVGRLVGVIERVQAFNEDTKQIDRIGLLPVNFSLDLGHRVWEVEFSETGDDPMLCINKNLSIENATLREFVARDPAFITLVYPEAFRRILERLIKEGVDFTDEESWQVKWARFAASFGVGLPPDESDEDEATNWVEQTVDAFCDYTAIRARFEDYIGEEMP